MGVDDAFELVDRQDFLPEEVRSRAKEDRPLPIGYGQTNSQPSTVRQMLEWLGVEPGQTILDIGSGSGWTAALLARLTGKDGYVYAVELVPELVTYGRDNCESAGVTNVTFYQADKHIGLPAHQPYDRILVSAGASRMPDGLLDQLKSPGKLVIPIGETIYEIAKSIDGSIEQIKHPGYVFVPLIS